MAIFFFILTSVLFKTDFLIGTRLLHASLAFLIHGLADDQIHIFSIHEPAARLNQ